MCAGRPVKRIRRALSESGRARRAAEGSRIRRTKIGRAINGVKEANVGRVEEIEGLREDLQAASLLERKGSSQAKISGAEIVANEGVEIGRASCREGGARS